MLPSFSKLNSPLTMYSVKLRQQLPRQQSLLMKRECLSLWERVDEPHKTYGYHQKLEGDYEAGDKVLLADDVATDGKSKVEGSQVLIAVRLEPVAITLQFDREEGGVQTLEQDYGFEVNSITTLSRAAGFLLVNGRIDNGAIDALQAYHDELRADGKVSTFQLS